MNLRICRHCRKPVGLNDVTCAHCRKKLLSPMYFKLTLIIMALLLLVALGFLVYGVYAYAQACAVVGC